MDVAICQVNKVSDLLIRGKTNRDILLYVHFYLMNDQSMHPPKWNNEQC